MSRARLVLCVLVPFAAGYYLSYLFRSINALIAGDLQAELGLRAADLGALTSAYFLVFAAVLLPCGVLLDRYGPRLVDSALLLVAAVGSLVFACADGVWTLMLGRALIGLGVAAALMAGLKAIVLWFPPHRIALANGWYIMLGALGALSATGPAERPRSERRMAWPVRHSRCRVGSRGASHSPHRTRAEAGTDRWFRSDTVDRFPGNLPGPALPAAGAAVGYRRRRLLVATGTLGSAVAHRSCRTRPLRGRRAPHLDGGRARRERPPARRPYRAPPPRRRFDRAVPCRHARIVDGGSGRPAVRRPRFLLSVVRSHRRRRRHDRPQLRTSGAVLPEGSGGPSQRGARRSQHGHRVRSAVPLRAHHRAVACGRRTLSSAGASGRPGGRPRACSSSAWPSSSRPSAAPSRCRWVLPSQECWASIHPSLPPCRRATRPPSWRGDSMSYTRADRRQRGASPPSLPWRYVSAWPVLCSSRSAPRPSRFTSSRGACRAWLRLKPRDDEGHRHYGGAGLEGPR